jgi:hypothetical protein
VIVEGDITVQTHRVFRNLAGILEAAGTSFDHVLRTTVYLADMNDFPAMNDVYGGYFTSPAPARSTVQAARLPKDARVEIDVIAEISNPDQRFGASIRRPLHVHHALDAAKRLDHLLQVFEIADLHGHVDAAHRLGRRGLDVADVGVDSRDFELTSARMPLRSSTWMLRRTV